MNAKNLNVILGIAVVVLLGVVGYLIFVDKTQEQTLGQQNNTNVNNPAANANSAQPANNANAPSNSDAVAGTEGWRTYTDTQNGFEFKFPASFKQENAPQLVTFAEGNGNAITIEVIAKKFDPNNIQGFYGPIENPGKVQMGTKTGYIYTEGDGGCAGAAVVTDLVANKTLKLGFGYCEEGGEPGSVTPLHDNQKLIEQILSTFKFTK